MFKKLTALVLTLLLCVAFVGCGESNNQDEEKTQNNVSSVESDSSEVNSNNDTSSSNSTIESQVSQTISSEPEKKIITHTAVQGCVIVSQDGSAMHTYKKKCESCGNVVPGTVTQGKYDGKTQTSFNCSKCGNKQKIEIIHSSN